MTALIVASYRMGPVVRHLRLLSRTPHHHLQPHHQLHHLTSTLEPCPLPPSTHPPSPLAGRPYLAGSSSPSCPATLLPLTEEQVTTYRATGRGTTEEVQGDVAALVDQQLGNKGAVLVRGLKGVLPTNALWLLEIRNNILLVNKISPKKISLTCQF